ncbi:MAG TPA: hypothetical protein VI876_05360 [Dehalococcoidia bacterium]|nr:hypothetical protein [Dehalococcoidia bacterium]
MFTDLELLAFFVVTLSVAMSCRYLAMRLADKRQLSVVRRKYVVVLSMFAGMLTSMITFLFGLQWGTLMLLAALLPFYLAYMFVFLWAADRAASAVTSLFRREHE